MKDSLIGRRDPEFGGPTPPPHMGSSAPRAAHSLWKEKPMLVRSLLRGAGRICQLLNKECVDLFGWHLNCTNACLVRWIKQYEASQR